GRNPGFFSQTEGEHQFALREITGSAAQHLPLLFAGILNSDHSANAVAVGTCAPQLYAQGVVPISTVISKQKRRTGIGGDEEVQIAVIINISIGSAPGDPGSAKGGACRCGDL